MLFSRFQPNSHRFQRVFHISENFNRKNASGFVRRYVSKTCLFEKSFKKVIFSLPQKATIVVV